MTMATISTRPICECTIPCDGASSGRRESESTNGGCILTHSRMFHATSLTPKLTEAAPAQHQRGHVLGRALVVAPLGAYDVVTDSFLVLDVNPAAAGWVWMSLPR